MSDENAKRSQDFPLLSYNCANILAHLIDFLICRVNPKCSNIHPANLIRLAYTRYKCVRANGADVLFPPILLALEKEKRFAYSSRHRLLILLELAEMEIMSST
jgi:hypothetical protein